MSDALDMPQPRERQLSHSSRRRRGCFGGTWRRYRLGQVFRIHTLLTLLPGISLVDENPVSAGRGEQGLVDGWTDRLGVLFGEAAALEHCQIALHFPIGHLAVILVPFGAFQTQKLFGDWSQRGSDHGVAFEFVECLG